ncbi:LacI family DNA-binding transcriptional regulator, partial [Xanthomonas oryzae]|uniref:LacI family DNA-binding transcriptional regulator n=1 Tax=Xanthomonas oryzae TaxID=347 RepID=UPI00036557EF
MSRPRSEGGSVTIKDVAREAQVSVATVSRTMNGHQHVAASVRERVLQVARALNYIPHHAARSLSSRRTHTIGVVLPDLHGEFFSELIRGIDQVARDQGYHLLVSSSHGDPQAQRRALERLPGRVDGVVVMSPSLGDSGVHEDALPGCLPAG